MNWIKDSKEWLDAGYLNKTVKGQWNDDWNKAMGSDVSYTHLAFNASSSSATVGAGFS